VPGHSCAARIERRAAGQRQGSLGRFGPFALLVLWLGAGGARAALPPPVSWSAAQQRASGLRIERLVPGEFRRARQAPVRAVWVPASAVLFYQGQTFTFVATRPAAGGDRQFTARVVSTRWFSGGGYVQPGWSSLDVVTGGADLLLIPPPVPHTLPPAGDGGDAPP
jgi:hypothetical protein